MVCLDENFDTLYQKEISKQIHPWYFWDNRDNSDFRILGAYCTPFPDNKCYETILDTSFSWHKMKFFSDDEDDPLQGRYDSLSLEDFYPTSEGGALFTAYKIIDQDYDQDVAIIKIDTAYKGAAINSLYNRKEKIIVFPNPNNEGKLFIENENWQSLIIYDGIGRLLTKNDKSLYNKSEGINIKDLQPGTYYVEIKFKDKTVYNKFIRY